ncbi:MAG: glycosyltransferase [Hyphomicrobiaceae bacterium]|nr:glycosyltransferase [Hyphomicrobiaceae bacterium]
MSADVLMTRSQCIAFASVAGLAIALWIAAPGFAGTLGFALLSLPFFCITALRLAALWHLSSDEGSKTTVHGQVAVADLETWPAYTLIVPLYREAKVAEALVRSLGVLDYPTDRLQILLVTEQEDEATRQALEGSALTKSMKVLTVPAGVPRTKPRALNYALTFATGEIVAIYDAEDAPAPDQLKAAARAMRASGNRLACVQARLDIYNPGDTFFTRQFTLEYAALFFALLPAYARLGFPLPLGGTSNHFSREALERSGGWDPFNVTEDADLGLRLARLGYKVAVVPSDTWEEAPATFAQWFGQRTRWIKGWMQTYLVHMRSPARLWRDLGSSAFLGFQMIFGGLILSALVHPLFYLVLAFHLAQGAPLSAAVSGWEVAIYGAYGLNVLASYASAMVLSAACARRRDKPWLARATLGLPVYWLMISGAAYMAGAELVRRPYHWAKTTHTGSGRETMP